jgi:CrcB protein
VSAGSRARLAVVAGGAVGTALRVVVAGALPAAPDGLPWATLLVNVLGAGALGYLAIHLGEHPAARTTAAFLTTGFLAAFTTFSTFAVEVAGLLDDAAGTAAWYAALSVGLGLAAAAGGAVLAGRAHRRSAP